MMVALQILGGLALLFGLYLFGMTVITAGRLVERVNALEQQNTRVALLLSVLVKKLEIGTEVISVNTTTPPSVN